MAVAHLAFQLGARNESGDGVDDDDVDRSGADENFGDLQSLLAAVGLRDEEIVDVDAELAEYSASSACSASMNAASPPSFCASAMTCSESVVLPDDSGPKISMMRPRGRPPTPRAASTPIEPLEMALIGRTPSRRGA